MEPLGGNPHDLRAVSFGASLPSGIFLEPYPVLRAQFRCTTACRVGKDPIDFSDVSQSQAANQKQTSVRRGGAKKLSRSERRKARKARKAKSKRVGKDGKPRFSRNRGNSACDTWLEVRGCVSSFSSDIQVLYLSQVEVMSDNVNLAVIWQQGEHEDALTTELAYSRSLRRTALGLFTIPGTTASTVSNGTLLRPGLWGRPDLIVPSVLNKLCATQDLEYQKAIQRGEPDPPQPVPHQ